MNTLSRQSSSSSLKFNSPDKAMTIIDGGFDSDVFDDSKISTKYKISTSSATSGLRRKTAQLLLGRKRSADKVRNFKSTMSGLRIDTEYVIKISFVLSGRKLGSESYR